MANLLDSIIKYIGNRGVFKDSNGDVAVGGDLTTSGSITAEDHSSPIGTVLTSYLTSSKSVTASTGTALCSITLPEGTWLILGYVRFPSNSTGYRLVNINITSGSDSAHLMQSPISGAGTQMQIKSIAKVTASSTTYYLNCYHTASTALTMQAGASDGYINGIRAVRIA